MVESKENYEYRHFTGPAELHKAVNILKGIVAGITTDQKASVDEINELANWCIAHEHLSNRHPFKELIPLIESAYKDGVVTEDEASDIVWLCNNFLSDSNYYDLITSSMQFLSGLLHGIMADEEVTDREIYSLKSWVDANLYLAGCYPFDEIYSLLLSILADGEISTEERDILKAFFSNFIDLTTSFNLDERKLNEIKSKYSIGGICSYCDNIVFEDNVFCFTGESDRLLRKDIAKLIDSYGGIFKNNITKKTRYLIVGIKGNPCWAFSCYGRKIEEAINIRKQGGLLSIISEVDFWDIVDDM